MKIKIHFHLCSREEEHKFYNLFILRVIHITKMKYGIDYIKMRDEGKDQFQIK